MIYQTTIYIKYKLIQFAFFSNKSYFNFLPKSSSPLSKLGRRAPTDSNFICFVDELDLWSILA